MTAVEGNGSAWLGLERVAEDEWLHPVTDGVRSGASALFGGCATAAAAVIAQSLAPQPVVFAASHFGALARLGATVAVRSRVVAAGRTVTHIEVEGSVDGQQSFLTRVTAGERPLPEGVTEGQWVAPPSVTSPEDSAPFEHPVHENTWAGRFEWRIAVGNGGTAPMSTWWVRPAGGEPLEPLIAATVLVDYVTYGVGRALDVAIGGLSIDNVVRMHRVVGAGWYLLHVMPEAIANGLGFGTARLFATDELVATGTQSIVVLPWDWRLPSER
jgi:acyl-CoA thioesterase